MFNVERLADERKHQTIVTLCAASYYSFTLIEYHPLFPLSGGLRGLPRSPFGESVGEEEKLVFDGVEPVGPVVGAGTGVELVRNLFLKEFLVHVAVHLVEEVLGAAIEDDVHGAGLEQMGEVDDGVLVPKLGILLVGAQTACYVPVLGEGTEIHSARHATHVAECVLMSHAQIEGSVAAHGQTCDGTGRAVGNGGVDGVDMCNEFLGNEGLVAVFGADETIEVPAVSRSVGHDNDEVVLVGQLSYCTVLCPYGVIATMAMEQIDDGIGLLGAIPFGGDDGDEDILVHAMASDGDFLLLEGKDASCKEQERQKGNELIRFHRGKRG